MDAPNPCLSCGACCTQFRVAFHWREGEDARPDGVPLAHVVEWNSHLRLMRGTTGAPPLRCSALVGEPGEAVACSIHDRRPSPCRDFTASWSAGEADERCAAARARIGLPPLTLADWCLPQSGPDPQPGRPTRHRVA